MLLRDKYHSPAWTQFFNTNYEIVYKLNLSFQIYLYFSYFRWEGKGENEVGYDDATNIVRVRVNPKYYRPSEVDYLQGDPSKAESQLGWKRKVTFEVC